MILGTVVNRKSHGDGMNYRNLREFLKLSQDEFYRPLGLTQSAGSRIETKRLDVAQSIKYLTTIVYGSAKQSAALVAKLRGKL